MVGKLVYGEYAREFELVWVHFSGAARGGLVCKYIHMVTYFQFYLANTIKKHTAQYVYATR